MSEPKSEIPPEKPIDIHALLAAFATATLPAEQWHHRAHVTVAMVAIERFGEWEALEWMRDGIRRLNRSHGLVETPTRGYHETVTRFWIWKVARTLEVAPKFDTVEERADFIWANCQEKSAPLEYWTAGYLWAPDARARWCEPDIKPLA